MPPGIGPADLETPEPEGSRGKPVGRRVFLGLLGVGAAGVVFGARAQEFFTTATEPVATIDPTGITKEALPRQKFRFYTVTTEFPVRAKKDYFLSVTGFVKNPLKLSYDDLLAMEPVNITRDFQCVTGWRVDDVKWKGVKLWDIVERAGITPEGKALRFTSFDGVYTESLTFDQARRDDVMVAYQLEGKDISSDHGGPVRLYVAPMYGYKSIKWLESIQVVERVHFGYWERLGYDVDAWVGKSNGRSDEPTS
ncbi:MAG TPA: molybdopterin-dependent oxidoreductase [Acidimicrobiia bacterium]|nr:molybdopterin-dependent oxidoreductase [Acidimicrobiia bacterium]